MQTLAQLVFNLSFLLGVIVGIVLYHFFFAK